MNKILFSLLLLFSGIAYASELNIYSARHYDSDQVIYDQFEKETGIKINLVEGKGDKLLARLLAEGKNSPADIFITVDAGNLRQAEQQGIFQATSSTVLEERIPENLRHPEGKWFGLSKRYRLIYYRKGTSGIENLKTYEDLADPVYKGRIIARSSGNIYNQSLLASMIAHHGEEKALAWTAGVVDNFARKPQGNDTAQLKAIASGEADIAIANSYYYGRLLLSDDPEMKALADSIGVILPNQEDRGMHVNISGAGILQNAPHQENALKFLEFMTSDFAQKQYATGNAEMPAVAGVKADERLSVFSGKEDSLPVYKLGEYNPQAVMLFDRAGWR